MKKYVGLLDGGGDVWGVVISDAPGVYGGVSTPEEAIADATSALREVGALLASVGTPLPSPRPLTEVLTDEDAAPDAAKGERAVMIPMTPVPSR